MNTYYTCSCGFITKEDTRIVFKSFRYGDHKKCKFIHGFGVILYKLNKNNILTSFCSVNGYTEIKLYEGVRLHDVIYKIKPTQKEESVISSMKKIQTKFYKKKI